MALNMENPAPGDWLLTLTGALGIYEVAEIHQQVAPKLAGATCLRLDLSQVDECDSAGLQWLMALRHWAQLEAVELTLEPLSAPVQSLVELFQAHAALGLTTLIPATKGEARHA